MPRGRWSHTLANVGQPTLYDRIGGDAGAKAVVRAVYQRVGSDPDIAVLADAMRVPTMFDADIGTLRQVLGGDGSVRPRGAGGLIMSTGEVVERHLRDALWLMGVSSALIDDVATAVVGAVATPRP